MKLSDLVEESRVVLDISSSASKQDTIRQLSVRALAGRELPVEPVIEDLLKREEMMSTGIGQGVAIPHSHTPAIEEAFCALGISRAGIEWDAVDGEPVRIVFLLVTPDSLPLLHVQTLGEMAGLFSAESVRNEIINAGSAGRLLEIIRSNEK
jgi:mannitol/fructose-specific phosphotransferase system IIA component (Ntr-type)